MVRPNNSQNPGMSRWTPITGLIEQIAGDGALIDEVAAEVRSTIKEIGALAAADVARHTRALLLAATRSIEARRGPSEAELAFVEELAVTRARQGVPIHAVLGAIHVAERRIWSRTRALAEAAGVPSSLVLEARELYDDWAGAVRHRLMVTHQAAEAAARSPGRDSAALRRLLHGGAPAALLCAESGLGSAPLVLVLPEATPEHGEALLRVLRAIRPGVCGWDGPDVVAVVRRPPDPAALPGAVGLSGPTAPEELPGARRLAASAARAAAMLGRTGIITVSALPTAIAVQERPDLAALLVDRHTRAVSSLGRQATATLDTVRTWLELGRDADAAAAVLFCHPNTVRNRVQALTTATGLRAEDPFEAVDLWWLCRAWERG